MSAPVAPRCAECGGVTTDRSCEELFHALLALDLTRTQPWAAYHGVQVACYLLQHPSEQRKLEHRAFQLHLVSVFCEQGLTGLWQVTESTRQQNSHRRGRSYSPGRQTGPVVREPLPGRYDATIHDVAVDGAFAAEQHGDRVDRWARAVRTAYRAESVD